MKKIFFALLLVAASGVCAYARDVRVLLKDGAERKGELAVTNEDSVFLKFKNGIVRKFAFADIASVLDDATGEDLTASLIAGAKAREKTQPAAKEPEAAKTPEVKKVTPARKAADSYQPKAPARALPDNVLGWMAARYDAKTLLGLKWEHPEKARLNYAFEKSNYLPRAGILAGSAERRGPEGRLEIVPVGVFNDVDAWTNTTDSYLELRYAKAGPGAAWNVGYISYSETREFWDFDSSFNEIDKLSKTEASVVYASIVLALPIPNFTYYGFAGPAIASYDFSETGTLTPWLGAPTPISTQESGTAFTWVAGLGFSLRADSGFGVFGEYKHLAGTGAYLGGDTLGLGLSLGF